MHAKFKNYLWNLTLQGRGQPNMGPPPPETQQTSIFLFSSLYASMLTKNKFFTFPARLIPPPGSRSIISVLWILIIGAAEMLMYADDENFVDIDCCTMECYII